MVTVAQLYSELRIGSESEEIAADINSILTRLLAVANSRSEKFAPGAPDHIKDRAVILYAGWLFESNPLGPPPANAFRKSGAYDTLWPWRLHGLGIINRDDNV